MVILFDVFMINISTRDILALGIAGIPSTGKGLVTTASGKRCGVISTTIDSIILRLGSIPTNGYGVCICRSRGNGCRLSERSKMPVRCYTVIS